MKIGDKVKLTEELLKVRNKSKKINEFTLSRISAKGTHHFTRKGTRTAKPYYKGFFQLIKKEK